MPVAVTATCTCLTKYCSLLDDSAYCAAVHVDVDVLTPAIQTVKKSANDVWIQLPPQVRTAAPFLGVGLGSSFIVYRIQQSRLDRAVRQHPACLLLSSCIAVSAAVSAAWLLLAAICLHHLQIPHLPCEHHAPADTVPLPMQHKKITKLEHEIDLIETERDDAQKMIRELRVSSACHQLDAIIRSSINVAQCVHLCVVATQLDAGRGGFCASNLAYAASTLQHQGAGGRGASEMEMVAAVSQATHAAAAAASAAAGAAAQCLYDPYFQHGPNGLAPRRRLPANRPQKPQ